MRSSTSEILMQAQQLALPAPPQTDYWKSIVQTRDDSSSQLTQELVASNVLTQFQADRLLSGRGQQLRFDEYLIDGQIRAGEMGTV